MKKPLALVIISIVATIAVGCAGAVDNDDRSSSNPTRAKAEAWDGLNDPALVDSSFVYLVDQLPLQGQTNHTPWPGDYWATYSDSINHRWNGDEPSPAEKVAEAFDLPDFPRWVTNNLGIYHSGIRCKDDSECDGDTSCVMPREELQVGEVPGRCVAGWWGICHGWSAAAVMVPQPIRAVTHNGVTFYPGDLEALASAAFTRIPAASLSARCNDILSKDTISGDGRIKIDSCRDMNAGSMYVLLANRIGNAGAGIVEDKASGLQVWNQPIRGYRVTNATDGKLKEIKKREAITLVGERPIATFLKWVVAHYSYNPDAMRFFHVKLELDYLVESRPATEPHDPDAFTETDQYDLLLETDQDGKILGGEWIGPSKTHHPDFMWWPTGAPNEGLGDLDYATITSLLDRSY